MVPKFLSLRGLRDQLERCIWAGFLLFLMAISFQPASYQSGSWLVLGLGLFGLCSVYLFLVLTGTAFNRRALERSSSVILLALASLFWLFVQPLIPFDHGLITEPFPDWWHPDLRISVEPQRSRWLFLSYLPAFTALCLGVCMLRSRARLKQLLAVFAFLGVLHAGIAILAQQNQLYLVDKRMLDGHFDAVRGWFINRNHFAAFMLACIAGWLPWLLRKREKRYLTLANIIIWSAIGLMAVAILMSRSRAGILGLALLPMLVLPVWRESDVVGGAPNLGGKRTLVLSLITAGLIIIALSLNFGLDVLQRIAQGGFGLGERVAQWQITWQAISHNPWFGYGGGSYASVFQGFRPIGDLRQVVFDQAHNDYLHLWLEQGLLGLALWLALIAAVFRGALQALRDTRSSLIRGSLMAGMVAVFCALLQSLVDFNLQIINLRCYFFVIIAWLMAAPTIHQTSKPN